jgi:hypothetical protein
MISFDRIAVGDLGQTPVDHLLAGCSRSHRLAAEQAFLAAITSECLDHVLGDRGGEIG